ncbi:transmembrane and coiled-coil domains protein 2 isoform X1 [Sigmodon hispidus]
MKRCKSDELQQQQGEEDGAGMEDAACLLPGADPRPGEASGANSAGGPTSDAGAAVAPNPGPRSKPPDLKGGELTGGRAELGLAGASVQVAHMLSRQLEAELERAVHMELFIFQPEVF